MRSRWTRLVVALAFNLLLLSGLALPTASGVSASCPAIYVVRPGDWLYNIARRFGVTVFEMLRLNPSLYAYPNLIYPGQVLCVPGSRPPAGPAPKDDQVAIEITYSYAPNAEEQKWNLTRSGFISTRVAYRLEPSLDALVTVGDTTQISRSVGGNLQPLLLGVRTAKDSTDYILVAVDKPEILTSLAISPTQSLKDTILQRTCAPRDLSVLGEGASGVNVTGTLSLEAGNGLRYPFNVISFDYVTAAGLNSCYGPDANAPVAFALFPAGVDKPGLYRTQIVLTKEGFGPPGYGAYSQCSGWYGGWYLNWLRAWYGC